MRSIQKWTLCGLLAVSATWWGAGCANPGTTGIEAGGSVDDAGLQQYIDVQNTKLGKGLAVTDVKTDLTGNNLMRATVTVQSKLNKTRNLQYKFAWFDDSGMEVEIDKDPWNPLTINGKEKKTLQALAPNSAAKSFKVRVRDLKTYF